MHIHSIKPSEEVGFRLLLFLLVFTLPLIAYVINHVNTGCFVSAAIPEHHCHTNAHPGSNTPTDAELQEDEFDEAVIPKEFHETIPVFEIPQPFRFEMPGCPRSAGASRFPRRDQPIPVPGFRILRC